jgi:quercetin dioxygenase-like cupin family protein
MKKKSLVEVKPFDAKKEGFKGHSARYLWTVEDGVENFAMRVMEFEPGGHTSFHSHQEEHEIFFLEGKAAYVDEKKQETLLSVGDSIFVSQDEPHQFKNVGEGRLRMI